MSILKILILGSNGFFGKSIKNLMQNKNYHLFFLERKDLDFLNKDLLNNKFQEIKPDIVIHCCGIIGSSESNKKKDQLSILNNNILLNINIFECCDINLVKKIILFSSYRIFSSNIHEFYNEDSLSFLDLDINNQNNSYLLSKKIMHSQMQLLKQKNHSIQIICLVLPNIFGCYDHFIKDGRIVPSIITRINECKNKNVNIVSNAKTPVSLIYVNDIIRLLEECICRDDIYDNVIIFNYTTTLTLEKLVEKIKRIMNSDDTIEFDSQTPYQETNIMKPDIGKFHSLFQDFKFSDLDESLQETIQFYLSNN